MRLTLTMTHQDDQLYIDQTLAGNVNAFAVLVERYKNMVYTLCIRMMKNAEDGEEIAQDVFVKAFQKLTTFRGTSKFSTWLYRIAYNRCLDKLAQRRIQPTHYAIEINEEITGGHAANILDVIDNEVVKSELETCIGLLKEEEGFLVTLYYLEEQTLEEIATITGLSKNTIKVKIFRSRKKLYEIMVTRLPKELVARYERT